MFNNSGVILSSVLGSLYFNIFIKDIFDELKHSTHLFADDISGDKKVN